MSPYLNQGCPYCAALKALFDELGVPFSEHVISEMDNYGDIVASLERSTGLNTAPNLFIAAKHVGGNDDAQNLHEDGQLVSLLNAAGVQMRVSAQILPQKRYERCTSRHQSTEIHRLSQKRCL